MINEFVYVAVGENDEVQWVRGSSRKTRYFKTSKYLRGAIEYHNKCYPNDKWTMKMCRLVATADPDWFDETEEQNETD